MPQRTYRHLSLVPDPEPLPPVEPNDLIRAVIIEPPGLTRMQRQKRKARMAQLSRAVEHYSAQLRDRP